MTLITLCSALGPHCLLRFRVSASLLGSFIMVYEWQMQYRYFLIGYEKKNKIKINYF